MGAVIRIGWMGFLDFGMFGLFMSVASSAGIAYCVLTHASWTRPVSLLLTLVCLAIGLPSAIGGARNELKLSPDATLGILNMAADNGCDDALTLIHDEYLAHDGIRRSVMGQFRKEVGYCLEARGAPTLARGRQPVDLISPANRAVLGRIKVAIADQHVLE